MSQGPIIAVDVLGGDDAPQVVLEGAEIVLDKHPEITLVLCGPKDLVEPFAHAHIRAEACATTQEITMTEHPASAVRKKKDSSLVVGCRLVKEGVAHGFFSAGSTGACLAAGTLVIGRIKGIARPALTTVVPSPIAPVVMCDVGANADCKPEYLVQFAKMGAIYAKSILGVEQPRIGLLNIGEEETKGSQAAQDAYALLRDNVDTFVGNAEGRDVLTGEFDVVVSDGFTGNVCLKTIEGTAKVLLKQIKNVMYTSPVTKLGALTMKSGLSDLKRKMDPSALGGAPLLGVKGACVVGHGSSDARAVANGIITTSHIVSSNVSEIIAQTVPVVPRNTNS